MARTKGKKSKTKDKKNPAQPTKPASPSHDSDSGISNELSPISDSVSADGILNANFRIPPKPYSPSKKKIPKSKPYDPVNINSNYLSPPKPIKRATKSQFHSKKPKHAPLPQPPKNP